MTYDPYRCANSERNKFGECRCPKCTQFYFDTQTCEIVWRCHGCGNYDPYGASGYSFVLESQTKGSVASTNFPFNHGSVSPSGRIPAVPNRNYRITARSPKCLTPRYYYTESPLTCSCNRGCGSGQTNMVDFQPGLIDGIRDTATLLIYDCVDQTREYRDSRGETNLGSNARIKLTWAACNSSWSYPIKVGRLGVFTNPFIFRDCKFHYVETDGYGEYALDASINELVFPGGGQFEEFDVGAVKTEMWWNYDQAFSPGAPALYAVANWMMSVRFYHSPVRQPTGTTQITPPSPLWAGATGAHVGIRLINRTDAYIPNNVFLPNEQFAPPNPFQRYRDIFAPGVESWLRWGQKPYSGTQVSTDNNGANNNVVTQSWCADFFVGQVSWRERPLGMFPFPGWFLTPGRVRWEAYY